MERGDFSKSGFWISLAVVMFVSMAAILVNSNITGGVTIQTISLIKEGAPLEINVREVKNVERIEIIVLEDVKSGKIEVKDIYKVSWDHPGKILSMFEVSSDKSKNFGSLKISLKVLEKELQDIKPNDLRLYHNGKELVTVPGERSRGYIEYTAQSPSMGQFLIGEKKDEAIKPEPAVIQPAPEPVIQQPQPVKTGFFKSIANFFKRFIGV
ncbi:MAG TPA: hypothetical protein VJI98_05170 [Candidatus Nanoarchaeia archaeon]|nr:hypothetical protein [Candidatus Nanoarchaeia archaeon]